MNIEQLAEKVAGQYAPDGNTHEYEWEAKFLGVSRLVSMTAEDYAQRILGRVVEDFNPKWGFLGNTIGDKAFADFDAHEVQFNHPLDDGWRIEGHCDGISFTEDGVVIGEHKYFLNFGADKNEKAARQALLYLALGNEMRKNGRNDMKFAAYLEADNGTFSWPANLEPAGVIVALAPSHMWDGQVTVRYADDEQCQEVLGFYLQKANAILKSVQTGDLSYAREWDESPAGIQEFTVQSISDIVRIDDTEINTLLSERDELDADIKEKSERVKTIRKRIEAILAEQEADKVDFGTHTVSRFTVPAKWIEAHEKKGYSSIRITKKRTEVITDA